MCSLVNKSLIFLFIFAFVLEQDYLVSSISVASLVGYHVVTDSTHNESVPGRFRLNYGKSFPDRLSQEMDKTNVNYYKLTDSDVFEIDEDILRKSLHLGPPEDDFLEKSHHFGSPKADGHALTDSDRLVIVPSCYNEIVASDSEEEINFDEPHLEEEEDDDTGDDVLDYFRYLPNNFINQ